MKLKLVAITLVLLASLSLVKPAYAFDEDDDGIIPAGQTINDDLLISAETVTIDGTVNGDVIASANHIVINGTVNGNLIMNTATAEINGFVNGSVAFGGQQLTVNSTIDGSVYFAGGELLLNPAGQINRNILFFGLSLKTLPGSLIGADIYLTGYQINLGGYVGHNILADVAAAEFSGRIGGDVSLVVGEPEAESPNLVWVEIWSNFWGSETPLERIPSGLRVSSEAEIRGQLHYKSGIEQAEAILIEPGQGTVFEPALSALESRETAAQLWLIARLRELLTLLALGGLILWWLPVALKRSKAQLKASPLKAFGWGFVGLIVGYAGIMTAFLLVIVMGMLLAIVTLGGLASAIFWIGISGLVMVASIFTLLVIYGSKIVAAHLLGELLLKRASPANSHRSVLALLIGVTIYMLLRAIPIVSILVGILATLVGIGAMAMAFKHRKLEMPAAETNFV